MNAILDLLLTQKELKYLTFSVTQNRLGVIKVKLAIIGITKEILIKDENAGLAVIASVILDMKSKEKWAIARAEKQK